MSEQEQVRRPPVKQFGGAMQGSGRGLGYNTVDLDDVMAEIDKVLDLAQNSHQMQEGKTEQKGCGCFG